MKKYLAFLLLAFMTSVALGQNNYQDVVYLKNGSIIRGFIIEEVPNKSIKIETPDRSVFVCQIEEIEKFTKETIKGKGGYGDDFSGTNSRYKNLIEIGYHFSVNSDGMDRLKLNIVRAYQFNQTFSLGMGTGLRYYVDVSNALLPIFVDFRTTLLNKNTSPYFSLGAGYSFNAEGDFQGVGVLINPGIGVRFKVSETSNLNIGLGFEIQQIEKFYSSFNYYHNRTTNAIGLDIGISF